MYYFFSTRYIISTIIMSLLIITILATKKLLKNHISVNWQYKIGCLQFVVLEMPFIPYQLLNFEFVPEFFKTGSGISNVFHSTYGNVVQGQEGWINDFAVSVNSSAGGNIEKVIFCIWFVGAIFLTVAMIASNYKLYKIKESIHEVDRNIKCLLEECKLELGIKADIKFGKAEVKSPMIFGLFKPIIILPQNMMDKLSLCEVKYILFHELSHYKNNDILVNYMICFFKAIYWFNPFVWIAFKQMELEREIVCDQTVLNVLDEHCYVEYGMTIIHFIENMSRTFTLNVAADMGGTKKQIRNRIEEIASFTKESFGIKIKSKFIFMTIFLLIVSQAPTMSVMALKNDSDDFENENILYENLASFFDDFNGSFVLYDLDNNQYSIYNEKKSKERVSPNSTYKIYSALFALESGVISESDSEMQWDGTKYAIKDWNQNQNLDTAMKSSVNWYFNALNKKTGFEHIKKYFNKINYGNCDFSGGEENYWAESSLEISPYEQVTLLKDFYLNNMEFKQENIDTVQSAIKLSQKNNAVLYGKTGTGMVNYKTINGWFIGYVEKGGNVYFFATNIQSDDGSGGAAASKIALEILKDKKIY